MFWNCHSYYSLRYGTMSPEKLVEQAKVLGIEALGMTDINNSTGVLDFVRLCKEAGIWPLAGIEFRDGDTLLYTCLAMNNEGFREINEFLSGRNLEGTPLPRHPPVFQNVYVIYPFGSVTGRKLKDHEKIGIRPEFVRQLLQTEFSHNQKGLVVQHPVVLESPASFLLHQNLRAIDHNTLITKLQPGQTASRHEYFVSPERLSGAYRDYPEIILNTEKMMASCQIDFDYQSVKNKETFTGSLYDDRILLEKLAMDGLEYRYGKTNKEAIKRIRHELEIIYKMGFSAYFLIAWDIIRYSMSRGFHHVGRGSGANSVVAYCLKITDVDPIDLNLYFERFINPKRTSPPDFDIDYSWTERETVQDYIFKRYGREHTALLGAMSTFKGRSILRELGKVYGLPKQEIDDLTNSPYTEINKNAVTRQIYEIARMMVDFPNIRSIHAGGVLISEKPITCYTALDMPPKGFLTTQWDMYVAEDFGFEKLDILSQRGIGHIKECSDIVAENRAIKVDVHQVERFKRDPKVKSQLKNGETNGCFYIESPAMRGLLKKLKCDNYLTLVAASSIIRPGVAKSGMMKEYIHRFHHPDKFRYIHPVMKEQLEETYGVMVYQEDVLKVCHHFAGLDLADADVLRRAMSGKFRSRKELDRIVDKFFQNCREKGYPEEITKEVWRQVESFAGYSFSKAHSASYAVESFQSLYLKAHYPQEFMVAVINNFGGFYRTWVYFNEARRSGAKIHLPCVNNSNYKTCIRGSDIYIGFIHVDSLERQMGQSIISEREKNGMFAGLDDFVERVNAGLEQLILLIRIGAFRFTGRSKAELLWDVHQLLHRSQPNEHHQSLFRAPSRAFELPRLVHNQVEDAYDEIELLGWPVSMTAFDLLQTPFRGEIMARDLTGHIGKKVRMVGNLVTIKYVRTVRKEIMHFAAFLDHEGEFFDTVHFPPALRTFPFKGDGVYLILGKVVEEFGFPSLEVEKMAKLPLKPDPRGR
ncbi:MAG: DNA polymerase III subunit alpha [Bacteroidales bacterium]|nr:DNA polymerase III subunit alpha [Bacteroidales bacterium]